jgi:capsular polysaccharide export protein
MLRNNVTDVVLFGDCRPYHVAALAIALETGLIRHLFEEGYVRPNWITCEAVGTNALSDMPRSPSELMRVAEMLPPALPKVLVRDSFLNRAVWDVIWTAATMTMRGVFPQYRYHSLVHPAIGYVGWLRRFIKKWAADESDDAALTQIHWNRLQRVPFFVLPMQLEGDFQIRTHSPFDSMEQATRQVLASFARAAPADAHLIIKRHPLDTSLNSQRSQILRMASEHGLKGRVIYIENANLEQLIAASTGCVVINSTSALMALACGCPLKVLGSATYAISGLAFCGDLDRFWTEGRPCDPALWKAYHRVLIARTQINGGFFSRHAIAVAVKNCVNRLTAEPSLPFRLTSTQIQVLRP